MNINLNRKPSGSLCTIGELLIDGEHQCYTLEDIVREQPDVPVDAWKIKGATAIPSGTYRITLTPSARFHRVLPLLNDVPGFDGIRIHPGNTDADTEGCILVGEQIAADEQSISQSRIAFEALYARLAEAASNADEITITITNGE